ncbi:heavy-metal-associated domain-containing protein [Nesterenkonia sp. CL21]|uniref:heavy-metal-associated domain-containing protein n=1 Tax=Nesterenkonia sp. CL21 TaxID=3064894 RepID=UPI00287A8104|nr:heavy-metal-associated domain-containing protein [Nesterenkonia sp. CL21]MDS2174304.1 heavy-metal-associated domain-containing protein [Nesterenkonia sp. CL21]
MKAPARLGLYGLILVTVFAVAGFTANAVVPDATVQTWTDQSPDGHHQNEDGDEDMTGTTHHGHHPDPAALGLGLAQDGYRLTDVSAPASPGVHGELTFAVTGPDGRPVTDFALEHEKELHLIVVRADGQHFAHVHPERDETGTWSIPWEWEAAGSYRIIADFLPAETGEGLTLSTTVHAGGDYTPTPAEQPITAATTDGFDVAVEGDLVAGEASPLTMTVSRDGEPVTTLEPYLGAFGHLVALRDGDLAYLHVHPHGAAPQPGETSGPEIAFEATAPTEGRYLLYLDFQVDGQVHTAPLVLDAGDAGDRPDHGTHEDDTHEDEDGMDHDH